MCCLYGVFTYGKPLNKRDLQDVVMELGISATARGTDATGIAYVSKSKLCIDKAPKSAYEFDVKLPDKVRAVMGHTRLTTQGDAKYNRNNHPFQMKMGSQSCALAHNGVLHNDAELRKQYRLPDTKIQTDSYVAVQLLEREKALNMQTIKSVVEKLEGSYCFTVLDNKNSLYLVKGNNPLYIIHHKELQTYFYASTSQILWRGIVSSNLFSLHFKPYLTETKNSPLEEIPLQEGQILKISNTGALSYESFTIKQETLYYGWNRRWGYNGFLDHENGLDDCTSDYIEQLRDFASYMGLDAGIVDILLDEGFCIDEVEAFINEEATVYTDFRLTRT